MNLKPSLKFFTGLFGGFFAFFFWACAQNGSKASVEKSTEIQPIEKGVSLVVLGTVQDAGSPQIGCKKSCCASLFETPDASRKVVSLGLLDPEHEQSFLFEATPDVASQLHLLKTQASFPGAETLDGVFLTHAHIGHYTGLMYFGKEAMNASHLSVYAMPRMAAFLKNNGPWSQLLTNKNIAIEPLQDHLQIDLTANLKITPLQVPHRDEFSETVGFLIQGPSKKALFIPDIDKWERWSTDISSLLKKVDYAFLDATFYDGDELPGRDISEIPHPFVIESMALFESLPAVEKNKVYFIHLNHTNPLLNAESPQVKVVLDRGFNIAEIGSRFTL